MSRLIWLVGFIAFVFAHGRVTPFSVRLNWFRIAAFGRLEKPYNIYRTMTVYFSPYRRLMNGLAFVIVALVDWLCIVMIIGLLYSLIIGNK